MRYVPSNPLDVVDGDGVHLLANRLQFLDRQTVKEHVQNLARDRIRCFDRQRKTAGEVILRFRQLTLTDPLALQAPELVDDQPEHFARRFRTRVRLGFEIARLLERVELRLRAVGEAALGPKHLVEPVAAFAAEDADREVHSHVIRVLPRNPQMPDPHFGLDRVGFVDHDHATARLGRFHERLRLHVALRPVAEYLLRGRERLFGGHVADDCEDGVVRHEIFLLKRREVIVGNRAERVGRTALRQAVRMEPVHHPIEYRVRDVLGILKADLQSRERLLFLAVDFGGGKRGVARHVRQHAHSGLEAVLHDHDAHLTEIG